MNPKAFIVRTPIIYTDKIKTQRTYVINPKKVRVLDYNPHFKKLDISFDNGEKFTIQNPDGAEKLYEDLIASIEQWSEKVY